MDGMRESRAQLSELVKETYSKCSVCGLQREEDLIVLPCIHVVCKVCTLDAMATAQKEESMRHTKYHSPRRFECPVCYWPQYRPLEKDGLTGYPAKLPLHVGLEPDPEDMPPTQFCTVCGTAKRTLARGFQTRLGNYVFESTIGSYGDEVYHGEMRTIMGMAVDEYYPTPLVVVTEGTSNYILSFHLHGRLEQARETKIQIRDVCIGPVGSVIVSVAEEDYALAKWDSALFSTSGGCRHENIFRNIYGHSSQIDSEPFGVAQDSRGRFVVTMLAKDRVCRWDERRVGDNIRWYGDSGEGDVHFNGPYYVAKLSNDFTVLSCMMDHKVKVIDDVQERLMAQIGGLGSDTDFLCYPHGVCVDGRDNIYIADTGNFRVLMYNALGEYVCTPVSDTWTYGRDVKPTNVAVMKDGRLLVAMQGVQYCSVHVYCPVRREDGDPDSCDCCCDDTPSLLTACCRPRGDYQPLN